MIQGSTIFVTGGTGFVGSHLVERLLERGASTVRCLVRSNEKWLKDLDVEIVPGDLSPAGFPAQALDGVDFVFHVAALTRARARTEFERANILGTLHLLDRIVERAPSVRRVLITSSLAVVGRGASGVADESARMAPVSMYGWSKMRMEETVREWFNRLPITIVRPSAVYGPRETDILTFFRTVSKGFCPIVGSAAQPAISLVHVDDLVRGMIAAALSPVAVGKTYFLGNREPLSWGRIRDAAAASLDTKVLTVSVPPFMVPAVGAVSEWWGRLRGSYPALNREKAREIVQACTMCDSSRAMEEFGYAPDIDPETGIARTIAWYRNAHWI